MEKNLLGLQNNNTLTSTLTAPKKTNNINALDRDNTGVAVRRDNIYKNIQEQANQSSEQKTKPRGNNLPKDTAVSGNKAAEKLPNNQEAKTETTETDEKAVSTKINNQPMAQKTTSKDTSAKSDDLDEDGEINVLINPEVNHEVMPVVAEDESSVSVNASLPLVSTDIELIKTSVNKLLSQESPDTMNEHITNIIMNNSDGFKNTSDFPTLVVQDDVVLANIDEIQEDSKAMNAKLDLDKADIEAEAAIHKKLVKELASADPIDEFAMPKATVAVIDSVIKPEPTMTKDKMSATDIMSNTQVSDTKLITNVHASKLTYKPEAKPENPLFDKIFLMINKNENSAKLIIDPPELGALEIKISQREGATHIVFNAQSIAAKDAIEAQINDLREIFGQEGLNLGDVGVFHQNEQNNNEQSASGNGGFAHTNESAGGESISLVRNIKGLVDLYA
ncbi:flagellar hook-length control protein FliK [Candidatus Berkiella cookevillensis]|uniref:Flagellar hook-length control protein FliK n=1 Tax=Candidatus Berkiella cookevillensis TaxID=437022 RepID=A0A0Q9YGW5_9GAMM|nr:flagellar hook-length control protein FliK [Candidatus Berkiella cookevillensis]MCS5708604.1 flagellar hook-length control protein FliK [Candidatus Berkiella cookevillensis]